jgi:hypothetical protein
MADLEALVTSFTQTGIAEIPGVLAPAQIERARNIAMGGSVARVIQTPRSILNFHH